MDLIKIIISLILTIAGLITTSPAPVPPENETVSETTIETVAETVSETTTETVSETTTETVPETTTETVPETTTETIPETTTSAPIIYGSLGHLFIPDANVSVGLETSDTGPGLQAICDQEYMAAYMSYQGIGYPWNKVMDSSPIIADHNYQGFDNIKNMPLGTIAYIEQQDGTREYYSLEFIDKNATHVTSVTIVDGTPYEMPYPRYSDGTFLCYGHLDCITLYTCNEDVEHITAMRFKKVDAQ